MVEAQIYCTLADVYSDLEINGVKDEIRLLDKIKAASDVIKRLGGRFLPSTEQKKFDGNGDRHQWIDELLAITAFTMLDGNTTYTLTSADYLLHPANRWWANGPYTRLEVDLDSTQIGQWAKGQQNLQITGRWGLYEETAATGATASQTDSATTLVVDNAGKLSIGAVVKIGDEQELLESFGAVSDSTADTSAAMDVSQDTIAITNGSLLSRGEVAVIDTEKMLVLEVISNTLVVARGYGGSKIATHLINSNVYVYRTFNVTRAVNGTTAAQHTTASVSKCVAPQSINYLCRQIAGLMHKKAQSGWSSKVGNAELGETFYYNEFPNDPLKKIMQNFTVIR